MTVIVRPAVWRPPFRLLDTALTLSALVIAVQLAPLAPSVRQALSPAAVAFDREMAFGGAPGPAPLTVHPVGTALALMAVSACVLTFWSARGAFAQGGVRTTVRSIAWLGLILTPIAIVQHAAAVPMLDQFWALNSLRGRPYGPFVNRNDFAGWLIMAIPLVAGYLFARVESRSDAGGFDVESAIDDRFLWLAGSLVFMAGGLLFSTSRSGLMGALAGLIVFAWIGRRRLRRTGRGGWWMLAALAAALLLATVFANFDVLTLRLAGATGEGLAGRLSIWRETWPVVRAFWPVGSGAGSFERVMIAYQQRSRLFHIVHADDEYLQILAEGGLLLGLPVALTLVAGVLTAARQLRRDHTAILWIRAGAVAGMVGLAVQNLVEMTLRLPATAVLFAVLTAIAVHEPNR